MKQIIIHDNLLYRKEEHTISDHRQKKKEEITIIEKCDGVNNEIP